MIKTRDLTTKRDLRIVAPASVNSTSQRNYLGEAFQIAQGTSGVLPERGHLVAVIDFARQFVSAAIRLPQITE